MRIVRLCFGEGRGCLRDARCPWNAYASSILTARGSGKLAVRISGPDALKHLRHPNPRSHLMTKRVATAVALILAVARAAAPAAAQAPELGVKVGLNRATVAWEATRLGDGFETLERVNALVAGLTLALPLSDRIAVRVEALRTGKGFREVQANGDETLLDASYLETPVLVALMLRSGAAVTPELYAGPYLARETSCRVEAVLAGTPVAFDCDEVPDDPVLRETTEWGAVVGVAIHLGQAGGMRGVLDGRYSRGLRNVDSSPDIDNLNLRHRGLALTLGLTLALGS